MSRIREWRRYGFPRTDAERRRRHFDQFGTANLPPRGTGRGRVSGEYSDQFFKSIVGGIGIAVGLFIASKLSGGTIGRRKT